MINNGMVSYKILNNDIILLILRSIEIFYLPFFPLVI